eukprot:scaffold22032_cov97-Isochrysis_galbana.AAC.2
MVMAAPYSSAAAHASTRLARSAVHVPSPQPPRAATNATTADARPTRHAGCSAATVRTHGCRWSRPRSSRLTSSSEKRGETRTRGGATGRATVRFATSAGGSAGRAARKSGPTSSIMAGKIWRERAQVGSRFARNSEHFPLKLLVWSRAL